MIPWLTLGPDSRARVDTPDSGDPGEVQDQAGPGAGLGEVTGDPGLQGLQGG